MGKKNPKATAVVERTAEVKITLVNPIGENDFNDKAGKKVMKISGVTGVYWDQNGHVVRVMVASTHTGRDKAIAVATRVASALGVEIKGDIVVM